MKNPERYHKSCDILFDAYFNDTLKHGSICGCAVGNLIAANLGIKVLRVSESLFWDSTESPNWAEVVVYGSRAPLLAGGFKQATSTGYTCLELRKIESAFEGASYGDCEEDFMFNGLVAVLDVLKEIHEVENDTVEIERFSNHYKTLCNA